ncbi:hypothetical protein DITRI_Ditri01bG0082100 [Diplodiscus trichospermus]
MKAQNAGSLHLKSRKPAFLFILSIPLLVLLPLSKATLSIDDKTNFTFPFFSPNMRDINYEGNASTAEGVIQLTINPKNKGLNGSVGRVTYYKPMHLWDNSSGNLVLADFSCQFSFVIDSLNSSHRADGFAFFLAPNGSQIPPLSGGGFLGLESGNPTYNSEFVAVEFDTYQNRWDPFGMSDHLAIDLNSVQKPLNHVQWSWIDTVKGGKVDAFIRTTGTFFEIHTIYSWKFSSSLQVAINKTVTPAAATSPTTPPVNTRRKSRTWLWVVLGIVGGIFALLPILSFVLFFYYRKKYRSNQYSTMFANIENEMVIAPREFSYKELRFATSNFADEGLLGEGGFGRVYLGFLRDMNCNIAVKKITPQSQQGVKEYASELRTVSRLRHRNLVQLIGWCQDNQELLIVYEFLPNKSLDYHLFREPCLLTWEKRYKIAMDLASALFYLQEECEQCVLHRDIKSSNVLLDLSFNAKLGDFGLARLVDYGQGSRTTILFGTDGYVAPECLETYRSIKESDVYSFGIVLLEIASGKQAIAVIDRNGKKSNTKMVEWVWELYGGDSIFDAADPRAQLPVVPLEMPVPTYIAAHQANIVPSSASVSSHASASTKSQA